MRAKHATYVFSSPLRRAVQTAEEIALVLGLELLVDERLRERTNWGDVEGETWDEFLFRWERADTEKSRARLASFVDDIAARYPHATIIAVTHGGIVGDYLGGHEDWPHWRDHSRSRCDHAGLQPRTRVRVRRAARRCRGRR